MNPANYRYYFEPTRFAFIKDKIFLDQYPVEYPEEIGEEDGEPYLKLSMFQRIFSPQMTVESGEDHFSIVYEGKSVRYRNENWSGQGTEWACPPKWRDGEWHIPVLQVLGEGLGFFTNRLQPPFFLAGREAADVDLSVQREEYYRNVLRGKSVGEVYCTFWNENIQKYLPLKMYIPTYLSQDRKFPLIVALHGGLGSPESVFLHTERKFSYAAEKRGFILLAPDACIFNSTYGCPVKPAGSHLTTCGFAGDEEELQGKAASEDSLHQEILWAMENFPVDRERVYLMGNSMGGIGTFYFGSRHRELFAALAPAGAAPEAEAFDYTGLGDIPILFTAGTEDFHGYDHMERAYRYFKDHGVTIELLTVGGGTHPSAWVDELDHILDYLLEKHR
ncbi:alpha/beta hydrolase-fold protein [Hominifimenecus sp. rT4P-3]|uniref:alpha/beta hydrolase-fold protein n=1 Tax=Hominifimenecus sp. rT4P-3 TaxID=3242979 RepID=UPI003DA273E6